MTIHKIIVGDCVEAMKGLPGNSIDSVVTDPPYGLEFMGKDWDTFKKGENIAGGNTGLNTPYGRKRALPAFYQLDNTDLVNYQEFTYQWATEVYRLLKPGGHLLSFGGTRTYHRMACAVEDAGFEIRDCILWIYGSGFPKSLDVSKAIDKKRDVKRRIIGKERIDVGIQKGSMHAGRNSRIEERDVTVATTPEAIQWNGWGTALKPAVEPIAMARKPLGEKTVAENVLKYGTGAINVDACRIPHKSKEDFEISHRGNIKRGKNIIDGKQFGGHHYTNPNENGRFPSNVIIDEVAAEMLDGQSGNKCGQIAPIRGHEPSRLTRNIYGEYKDRRVAFPHDELGGASRFFYTAKAQQKERWFVCKVCNDAFNDRSKHEAHSMHCDDCGVNYKPQYNTRTASDGIERAVGGICQQQGGANARPTHFVDIHKDHNTQSNLIGHPTQKPLALIEYLVKLITPPNGIVFDPFLGSGTLTVAARNLNFDSIGIEQDDTWIPVYKKRLRISEQLTDDTTYEIITGS